MNIHKIVLTIIDFDDVGAEECKRLIEENRCINPHVISMQTREIGDWSDDHPLNHKSTEESEIKRLFWQG